MILKYLKENYQRLLRNKHGNALLFVMIFGTISLSIIVVGLSGYAILENMASNSKYDHELALQIADAGINYYRWHLAHNKTDFYDGNSSSTPGPYVHDYTDKSGNVIGQFALTIIPPTNGSTVITIQSAGTVNDHPNIKRVIQVRVGFPSLADYSVLQNANLWLRGPTFGKVQANGGIRFDGTASGPVVSAMATYTCPSIHACSGTKPGVWGAGGPTNFWQFPVPAKDFSGIVANVAQIKAAVLTQGGGNWPYLSSSGVLGWRLQFVSNGTVNVSKVLTCEVHSGWDVNDVLIQGCLDPTSFGPITNYSTTSTNYIYVEDNIWVEGILRGRISVVNAPGKSIVINDNLTYAVRDGTNALALISDQNIFLPYNVRDVLNIDAVLLAQNGTFERYDYTTSTILSNLNVFGSRLLYKVGGASWFNGSRPSGLESGFLTQSFTYDANLTYAPPPGLPVGSEYDLLSWEILK